MTVAAQRVLPLAHSHAHLHHHAPVPSSSTSGNGSSSSNGVGGTAANPGLFIDPMMGAPLAIYIEKDVADKDLLADLIVKHGGTVSPSYSSVAYILVDPHKESGQNLYRQYAGMKSRKIVLDARWVHLCFAKNELQTFQHNWAGCRVTGQETLGPQDSLPIVAPPSSSTRRLSRLSAQARTITPSTTDTSTSIPTPHAIQPSQTMLTSSPSTVPALPPTATAATSAGAITTTAAVTTAAVAGVVDAYPYAVFGPALVAVAAAGVPQVLHTPTAAPPQTWQAANEIAPQQTHLLPRAATADVPPPFRDESDWESAYHHHQHQQHQQHQHHHHQHQHQHHQQHHPHHQHHQQHHAQHHQHPHPHQHLHEAHSHHHAAPEAASADALMGPSDAPPSEYDYRYARDEWVGVPADYYDPTYNQAYEPSAAFMTDPSTSSPVGMATAPADDVVAATATATAAVAAAAAAATAAAAAADKPRGRRRTRTTTLSFGAPAGPELKGTPGVPASTLVVNARHTPARSPTPPTRVIKSTYGGNLFTADDVEYLKKYIDYCQEQGVVLSLREICERIAIKAPHHTFYSWRRYCNKHQIRLGGYSIATQRAGSADGEGDAHGNDNEHDEDDEDHDRDVFGPELEAGLDPAAAPAADTTRHLSAGVAPPSGGVSGRDRSPTPPRALFRSTTGKGVAFTQDDVAFLVKFMEYRKSKGRLDMATFWKDVAARAPHHSRASWVKYWRRHKHELHHSENDEPIPKPPEKKMRYSRDDDVLLARYFSAEPEGTSDKVFQAFGRQYPHHPWKGWQEHHRIHKAKIDHLVQKLQNGESIDEEQCL